MSLKKISVKNMKDGLSRDQMKKITGGSGYGCSLTSCYSSLCCTGYICRIHYYPGGPHGPIPFYLCGPV